MRKIETKKYAEILFSIAHEESEKEYAGLVSAFVSFLSKHKALSHIHEIEKAYTRLIDEKDGRLRAVVHSPIPLANSDRDNIENGLKKIFEKREIELQEEIDPTLIGGWKIRTENYLIDRSTNGQLERLKTTLTK